MDACSKCIPAFKSLTKLQSLKPLERSRTNPSVSETGRQELSAIIDEATNELTLYDRTIARLQDMMWKLENERQNLQSHIDLARTLLSPIRKLPGEVLGEIFIHHGQENAIFDLNGGPPYPRHRIPALLPSSVCSFWRKIAFATTQLWTNITTGTESETRNSGAAYALVQLLLQNSRNAGLHLEVDLYLQSEHDPSNLFFPLLCEQSHRWCTFTGKFDGGNPRPWATLSLIRGSLGRLRELSLFTSGAITTDCQEVFKNCPLLTSMGRAPRTEVGFRLPVEQITNAEIYLSEPWWYEEVTQFPNIQSLQLNLDDHPRWTPRSATFTSPVRELTLFPSRSPITPVPRLFFRHARFPKMHTIIIDTPEIFKRNRGEPPSLVLPISEFKGMLKRSSCTITTLTIMDVIAGTTLVDFLSILPTVTNFTFHSGSPSPRRGFQDRAEEEVICRIIGDMTPKNTTGKMDTLLPKLTSLSIQCFGSDNLTDQLILSMLRSRWQPSQTEVATIKSFEFHRKDQSFGPEFVRTMLHLKLNGLLLSVHDSDGDIEVR